MSKPSIIIIGAGFTGVATAHDLVLRGFDVTVVERGEIASGTSGRTHGLLHSGGRYAVTDQESAIECIDENLILRQIVPQVIEPNGGLFVALDQNDLAYADAFIRGCNACHIPIEELAPVQTLELEPNLNPHLLRAFSVPDATFDPLRLALAFAATARRNGAIFRTYTEMESFIINGQGNVAGIKVWDRAIDNHQEIGADLTINATGAWVGEIARLAGAQVPISPTPGVMVAFDQRLVQHVINRLNEPSDGDIVLPQRRLVVAGTTSFEVTDLDYVPVEKEQVRRIAERVAELVPAIGQTHQRGAFMATRPLINSGTIGRSLARTFKCFDHQETDSIGGLVTITGGKATTLRAMAEVTADIACAKLGVKASCSTKEVPLLSYREYYRR